METLAEIIHKLKSARHVVVFTGAGVSAESGIPTFRDGMNGLWSKFSPEELASVNGFKANPKRVWEWYASRRDIILGAKPNSAHLAIASLASLVPELTLITQNIDGLHQLAGSTKVIELHGSIHRSRCFDEDIVVEHWDDTDEVPPRCPNCGGLLRPDVVWFGESLSNGTYGLAKEAVRNCDFLFSIGTSSQVYPAAVLPVEAAYRGAMVVQINPNLTELDSVLRMEHSLRGTACEWMPAIVNATWSKSERV